MIQTTILERIFFDKDSEEGLAKQNALAGRSGIGRLCTVHMDGRKYPYRFTKADLCNYERNIMQFLESNPAGPDPKTFKEFRKKMEEGGLINSFTMLLLIFEDLLNRQLNGGFKDLVPEVTWESISGEIEGYAIEIFLVQPNNPYFVFEFYPAFAGDNLDNHYGSYLRSMFPLRMFTQHQIAYMERQGWAAFFQTVFLEKMFRAIPKAHGDEYDKLFMRNARTWVSKEWDKGTGLWSLRSKDTVFNFISKFANELAAHNGIEGEIFGAFSQKQISFAVKNAPKNATKLN